jgi:hypothetical protein
MDNRYPIYIHSGSPLVLPDHLISFLFQQHKIRQTLTICIPTAQVHICMYINAVLCIGIVCFDAYPDPDPDWQQNDADSHADPSPSKFYTCMMQNQTFSHSIASLQCFVCLMCHNFQYF